MDWEEDLIAKMKEKGWEFFRYKNMDCLLFYDMGSGEIIHFEDWGGVESCLADGYVDDRSHKEQERSTDMEHRDTDLETKCTQIENRVYDLLLEMEEIDEIANMIDDKAQEMLGKYKYDPHGEDFLAWVFVKGLTQYILTRD